MRNRVTAEDKFPYLTKYYYAPDQQRCLCLFEAAGPELVRAVNDLAQFPLARVVAVLSSVPGRTQPDG